MSDYPDQTKQQLVKSLIEDTFKAYVHGEPKDHTYFFSVDGPTVKTIKFHREFFDDRDIDGLKLAINNLKLIDLLAGDINHVTITNTRITHE